MDEIRKAYDSFLHEFPLCYVYWKKYADHEEKRGFIERAFAIYENGVTHGIPHSVELWTYYLAAIEKYNNDPEVVTSLYKRAISIVGKDYASHPVWDRYIMYAKNSNNHPVVLSLYEQISKIPLERSESYWDGYKSVLTEYPLESIFTDDQLIEAKNSGAVGQYALKEWLVSQKESIWRKTIQQAALRREWELQILTMSFFDIQPLPESKLDIWRNYIIFEQDYGTPERVIKLYERCIISCCNYSEFWYNYSRYLESHHLEIHVANGSPASTYTAPEAREVLLRATTKYLKRRPDMHIYFAFFEEYYKNYEGAVAVFDRLLKIVPGHIESLLRYISFERRRKNFDKCERLFNTAISEAAIVSNLLFLYIQYGTFLGEAYPEDSSHARRVFDEAIDMYPGALDLWRAYILYEKQVGGAEMEATVISIFEKAIYDETLMEGDSRVKDAGNPYSVLSYQDRCELHLSFIDFLCDYGSDVKKLREIEYEYKTMKLSEKSTRKRYREHEEYERESYKKQRLLESEPQTAPKPKNSVKGNTPLHYHFGYEGVQ